MMHSKQHENIGSVESKDQLKTFSEVVGAWIRRNIIDEDPYDAEVWKATLLHTQVGLNTEAFPQEFY